MPPLTSSSASGDITEMTIKIGFIGAGKVGAALGKYIKNRGFCLSGYWSRTYAHAADSAEFTDSRAFEALDELVRASDIIFITVADRAIAEVAEKIAALGTDLDGKTFCHTSGALSSEVLDPVRKRGAKICGAHMLTAVSGRDCDFSDSFFTVEGECGEIAEILKACGNRYKRIDPKDKVKYHAAAVFASNFVVGLADTACDLLDRCGFSEREALDALAPLMENNVKNIIKKGAKAALTGPVSRGDLVTVERHLECLKDTHPAKEIYEVMTGALKNMCGKKEK